MPKKSAFHPPVVQRKYMSVQDAFETTGLSAWTWRRWAYAGKIASVKAGRGQQGRLLIPVSEIERVMAEGTRPAVTK